MARHTNYATGRYFPSLHPASSLLLIWNLMFLVIGLLFSFQVLARAPLDANVIAVDQLPQEAQNTLTLIKQGGPFPYAKDGVVFGNYEGVLPRQRRGYYHEFTVPTPRVRHRGARRIVVGGDPLSSTEYYYTANHYQTFRRIQE